MNLTSVLEYSLPFIIGFMLECICYGKHRPTTAFDSDTDRLIGIYSVIFAAFIRIRLKRHREDNGSRTLLYLVTANFIACTAYLALDLIVCTTNPSIGEELASNTLYTCIDFISQLTLVNYFHTTRIRSPLMRVAFRFQ